MTAKRKPFSKKLYGSNDEDARTAVKAHLGRLCEDNPDQYGVDLMYRDKMIEVEIKQHWGLENYFPFQTVQIAQRKGKFADTNTEFWILNRYINRAIIIPSSALRKKYLKEVPNRYVKEGEFFYCIPVRLCEVIKLTGNP